MAKKIWNIGTRSDSAEVINIAKTLGIGIEYVGIKATTEEGLGFTGKKEGIAASAVCIITE